MKKLLLLLMFIPCGIYAQEMSGVVSDAMGPLPGVNVKVQGTNNGASTDFDGNYALKNLKKGDKIDFSYIGYKVFTVVYNGQKSQNVTLQEDAKQLDEVVLVGYGAVKKRDATGAVNTVSAKDFNKGPMVSADQLLVGKTPGVRITNDGGQPDSNPNIRIRGGSSLNSNNNPLIIIDGVPIDNVNNPAGISNPLTLVNPNDVESFTVLKDASATAIYGSRASNGVIIITTKKGTSGKPQFSFSTVTSIGVVSKPVDVMDGKEFTAFIQKYHPSYTNRLGVSSGELDANGNPLEDDPTTPQIEGRILYNTDWQKAIYRTSFSRDHNFSTRANLFGKVPFRASLGHSENEGLVQTSDLKRSTASIKLSPTLLDNHLKIDVNAKGILVKKNAIDEGGALGGAVVMDPTKPIYDSSSAFGGYYQSLNTNNSIDGQTNPVAILKQRTRPEETKKLLANIELDYNFPFFKDLRAVTNLGIEASSSKISERYVSNALQTYTIDNDATKAADLLGLPPVYIFNPGLNYSENQTITNKTLDAYLAYNKPLKGFVTRVDGQAGYSYQNFVTDGTKKIFRNNIDTGLRETQPNPLNPTNRYYNERNLQSFFGRGNFDLLDKYLFTFTLRADASSLFKKDRRWGYFPAVGFAWRMKDESFIKNIESISDLKLRLGWGITGQQDVTTAAGSYPYSALFVPGSATSTYFPGIGIYYAKPFNPNLTWEKTTTYNAGVDFDLFKNFISGGIDVYKRYTTDLLSTVSAPPGQALTNEFIANVGSMENKGFELNLNIKPVVKENISVTFNGNIAYNIGQITDLNNRNTNVDNGSGLPVGTGAKLAYNTVGQQPYSAWVFEQVYDANSKPIQGAFVDKNKDGVIDDADKSYVALRPNWTYGFGVNITYKKFDLSSSFRGQIGGKVYNGRKLQSGWINRAIPTNSNSLSNVLNTELDFTNVNGNTSLSDYFLENASFLRCQNITIGYTIDKVINGGNMKLYVSGNNLFLITKYSGQDPENFNAIDNNFYPRPRVFSFGVNLDF